jgi:RNA polymerase sigma-70 factor (ECF subfamily)
MTSPAKSFDGLDGATLVDGLREPLTKFVYGFVRDHHATEDLVQETLLKALRNLHRYRGQAAVKTWVFTIARNLCLDHLRHSGRSRLRLLGSMPDVDQALPDPLSPEPGRTLEQEEVRAEVTRALSGLPADARELLILRIYLGLSYREIARRRGVAPAGMGTRLLRARRGLSERLPEDR